ncbi:MAG: DUF1559 domain-containing protein [Pirellulaceae bacterium]
MYGSFPVAALSCQDSSWISTGIENGNTCQGPNWAQQLLGFMSEPVAYLQMIKCMEDFYSACDDCDSGKLNVNSQTPQFMVCPSSVVAPKLHESPVTALENLSKGNYAATLGSGFYNQSIELNRFVDTQLGAGLDAAKKTRGVIVVRGGEDILQRRRQIVCDLSVGPQGMWKFAHGKATKLSGIHDGISKTILISEVLPYDGSPTSKTNVSEDTRGVWASVSMGASTYSHFTTPNYDGADPNLKDTINGCDSSIPKSDPLACILKTGSKFDVGATFAAARSMHPGGVVAARADGSARFYPNSVERKIWQALATRSGGEDEPTIE